MINRAKMPRQLRNKGGITNVTPRTNYFLGGIKDRIRKLIPNEIANVAVKAAPFVAPFNPAVAGLMRGIGRFDQRGSISDAFKQGLGTYAGGQLFRTVGGAGPQEGLGGFKFSSPLSPDRTTAVKDFFTRKDPLAEEMSEVSLSPSKKATEGTGLNIRKSIKDATGLFKDTPILKNLPSIVQQQILVGGVSGALTYVYQAFLAEEPPQEEGETYEEYMTRRKANVGRKMKGYFDNYFKFDKNYSSMSESEKQAFIDRVNVKDGGRIEYQTGGITMANTLAENMRRNLANQAAVAQQFRQARANIPGYVEPVVKPAPKAAPIKIEEPDLPISKPTPIPGGDVQPILPVMPDQPVMLPMEPPRKIIPEDPPPLMDDLVKLPVDPPKKIIPVEDKSFITQPFFPDSDGDGIDDRLSDEEKQRILNPDENATLMPIEEIDQIDMTRPPGTPSGDGALTVMPIYNNPLPRDELLSGFEQFKKDNPEVMQGAGTAAMIPVILPGGYSYDFSGSLEANAFRKYLESIGQAPYQGRAQPIKSISGGLSKLAKGGMPTGIMTTNKAGVMERDYRDKGGFVPVGIKEKADDVPAMLSKNEFVMTADAVRGAGNGSIEKGAQRMYDTMKNLEKRVV
jgi:hypothetical protein